MITHGLLLNVLVGANNLKARQTALHVEHLLLGVAVGRGVAVVDLGLVVRLLHVVGGGNVVGNGIGLGVVLVMAAEAVVGQGSGGAEDCGEGHESLGEINMV